MNRFPPLDVENLTTVSLKDRQSKVRVEDFSSPWTPGNGFSQFLNGLPRILAAGDLSAIAEIWARAVRNGRTVILAMGGHPVKVGLSPLIVDLMQRKALSLVAVNGSVMVHDTEVAMIGSTSEDVAATLGQGAFGVTRETNSLINRAARDAADRRVGLGAALGRALEGQGFPHEDLSLFVAGRRQEVPVSVHVAMGTDVYHIHSEADGGAIGQGSFDDFRIFCAAVATLDHGLFINLGSAVVMPEAFLKAVTLARNLGRPIEDLTTVNMDFIRQYRPSVNVVERPTQGRGRGFHLIGHHEIMFPLLTAAMLERLEADGHRG